MESTISQKPLGREKYVAEVIVFLTYYFAFERKNMELKQFSCLRQLPFSEHTGLSLKPQTPINRNWPINLLDAGKRKGKLQGRFAYAGPPTGCQDWELSRQASPPLRKPYQLQVVKALLFQDFTFVLLITLPLKLAFWNKGRHYKIKSNPLTADFEALCEFLSSLSSALASP